MLQEPLISLYLPMRISVIENKDKTVSIVFTNTAVLAKKYKLKDNTILTKMQALLENIVASINS